VGIKPLTTIINTTGHPLIVNFCAHTIIV